MLDRRGLSLFFMIFVGLATLPAVAAPRIGIIERVLEISSFDGDRLSLPTDVATTRDGRIYVVDGGNSRVVAFSPFGDRIAAWGRRGSAPGEFTDPLGIAVGPGGEIFIADAGNHRIQIFSREGQLLREFAVKDREGKDVRPADIAISADQSRYYITGNSSHSILVFDKSGKLLAEWGKEGVGNVEFRYPATLQVKDDRIFVVDVLNTRVQVLNPSGEFMFQVGEWGVAPGQLFRPKGVAIDSRDRIYVTDSYMDLIQVFDSGYRLMHILGTKADAPTRFVAPSGIAIDRSDRLIVCEPLANKISVYQLR